MADPLRALLFILRIGGTRVSLPKLSLLSDDLLFLCKYNPSRLVRYSLSSSGSSIGSQTDLKFFLFSYRFWSGELVEKKCSKLSFGGSSKIFLSHFLNSLVNDINLQLRVKVFIASHEGFIVFKFVIEDALSLEDMSPFRHDMSK